VRVALLRILKSKPAAVVLDLRGNPGGYLEEAVSMAGFFLGDRAVVAVVEPSIERTLRDFHSVPLYTGPLVVLVDELSASAAEILAGALKDHQRAVVLGPKRTYGKGSVQRLFHLNAGSVQVPEADRRGVLKLTTSFFYSPLGQTPANGGVAPHWVVDWNNKKLLPEERPAKRQKAPRRTPFIDGKALAEIRMKESLMESRIATLKEFEAVRAEDIRAGFEQSVRQAFGEKIQRAGGATSLGATLAIAADLAELEQAKPENKDAAFHRMR
jgi:C-terminal processing protease CtpA/Prc